MVIMDTYLNTWPFLGILSSNLSLFLSMISSIWLDVAFSLGPCSLGFRPLVFDITTRLVLIGPPLIAKINLSVAPFSTPHSSNDKESGSSLPIWMLVYIFLSGASIKFYGMYNNWNVLKIYLYESNEDDVLVFPHFVAIWTLKMQSLCAQIT